MSIPKWRYVEYTDDGCTIYQCLSCYGHIEGRLNPADWKYCPYCGVEWEGEHKWLIYDDNYKVIEPARRKEDRRIPSGKISWNIELQELSLFRRDDGAYESLGERDKWSSLYYPEDNLFNGWEDCNKITKHWRDVRRNLIDKYGIKYGDYIYYKKFTAFLLESVTQSHIFNFADGCDYRLRITQEKWYRDIIQEHLVDLGGWKRLKDEGYEIRYPNSLCKSVAA